MLSQEELSEVFSDVTPIPQDDGPNPVCAIDYSPQFIQAYDYMRAILKMGEKSGEFIIISLLTRCFVESKNLMQGAPFFSFQNMKFQNNHRASTSTDGSLSQTQSCQLFHLAFSTTVSGNDHQ